MLDLTVIRNDPQAVKAAVRARQNPDLEATVDQALSLDSRRRELLKEVETLKADRNTAKIGRAHV